MKEGKLERVAHGVYLSPDAFDDEMYVIQVTSRRAIFSHGNSVIFTRFD